MTDLSVIDVADQARFDSWVEELKDPTIYFALLISRFPTLRTGTAFLFRCERTGRTEGGFVVEERKGRDGKMYALLRRDPSVVQVAKETK